MTSLDACPICGTPRPADRSRDGAWCCSIACYRAFHDTDGTVADDVMTTCPACQHGFRPVGQQSFCCDACRVAVYRRGQRAAPTTVVVQAEHRQPIAVYECDCCGARAAGERRCEECRSSMRRVGLGGRCPRCDEPVAVGELLGQEVTA